ncbi:MAG: DNA cytosine methyltransferase [Litorimonas sp.]
MSAPIEHTQFEAACRVTPPIVIDLFAGGGGASKGMQQALGQPVDVAINHNEHAIAMHKRNHPEAEHYIESVYDVDPAAACRGRPILSLWASPDCKHFSRAAGGKPKERKIRALAWVVVKWATLPQWQRPRMIFIENVSEFLSWAPTKADGTLDRRYRPGATFRKFVKRLRQCGYQVEWRELRADWFGAPTIRKRLFLVARCDGQPIVWPARTHADPSQPVEQSLFGERGEDLKPWRTAAEIIDWSQPRPSIFTRKKPLAHNTLKRIAAGIQRFVIEKPDPYLVKVNHGYDQFRGQSLDTPLQTVTSKLGTALVAPVIDRPFGASSGASGQNDPTRPLGAVTAGGAGGKCGLVAPVLDSQYGKSRGRAVDEPLGTVTAGGGGKQALVAPQITVMGYGEREGQSPRLRSIEEPLHTVTAGGVKAALAAPVISTYYGSQQRTDIEEPLPTVTTRDRFAVAAPTMVRTDMHKSNATCAYPMSDPLRTITSSGGFAMTAAFISQQNLGRIGRDAEAPLSTVTTTGAQQMPVTAELTPLGFPPDDHSEAVAIFLMDYLGRGQPGIPMVGPIHAPSQVHRFGTVEIGGRVYRFSDITLRMLTPRELFNAQGFPSDYDIMEGELSKAEIVAKAGNSVCPPVVKAVVGANARPYANDNWMELRGLRRKAA